MSLYKSPGVHVIIELCGCTCHYRNVWVCMSS